MPDLTQLTTLLRQAITWAAAHPELATALTTAVAGSGRAAQQFHRTGKIPLATLPWRALRRLAYAARKRFFTIPRPRKKPFVVDEELSSIRDRLATESFEPAWALSYRYHGEDLNARRYYFDSEADYPHRQIHVRGFELERGAVELQAHDEPAPKHHPKAHLQEVAMRDATDWIGEAWERPSLDPRTFEYHA